MAEETLQYSVFLALSIIIILLTAITQFAISSSYQRFFGKSSPLLIVSFVVVIGFILLSYPLYNGRFAIYESGNIKGILLAIVLAVPFAMVMIIVDWKFPFPPDINVEFPHSLAFYPVMGYVVEILFHVLPISLLLFVFGDLVDDASTVNGIWIIFLIVALLEPLFQVVFAIGDNSIWVVAYLFLHLFLFNLLQLFLFWRYDFMTMYSFRLSYYLLWHIVWGHLRLSF